MKSKQSGFTLIEIAIVLVIIGLLLGGVLKGQELINSAKVKSFATDFKNIPVYIYGYQDKYRALPGDQAQAALDSQFPPANTGTTCTPLATGKCAPLDGIIEGNWNDLGAASETYVFWQHVRLGGFAPGTTTIPTTPAHGDGYLPQNAAGGEIGLMSGSNTAATSAMIDKNSNPIRGSYVICSTGILGKYVKQLDLQMDDGDPSTGSMLAAPVTGYAIDGTNNKAQSTTAAGWNDAATYVVCMGI